MPFAITLVDFQPVPRYPPTLTPWTEAQWSYAAAEAGPFAVFDTVALTPPDADPAHPQLRNLTTLLAPAGAGFFQVTFLDAALNEDPKGPVPYPLPGSTYSGDPSSSDLDAVRFEISDTDSAAPLLGDQEILFALASEAGPEPRSPAGLLAAAARCLETLARRFAAQADTEVGDLKLTYSKQAAIYAQRASELRLRAQGSHAPYAGGMSTSEKQAARQDDDRVQPVFARDQFRSPYTGSKTPQFPISNEPVP